MATYRSRYCVMIVWDCVPIVCEMCECVRGRVGGSAVGGSARLGSVGSAREGVLEGIL